MDQIFNIKQETIAAQSGLNKKDLTYIIPYYNNPTMFARQLGHWALLDPVILNRWRFIVIDDCSNLQNSALNAWNAFSHSRKHILAKHLNIYYILQDSLLGMHEARNIGAHLTTTEYNFFTDMDMELSHSSFELLLDKLTKEKINHKNYYTVGRAKVLESGTVEPKNYHCNTFVVSQTNYWQINGYDIDYVGTYGGDGPFARQLEQVCRRKHLNDITTLLYGREIIPDASTQNLDRYGDPKTNYRRILKWKNKVGAGKSRFPIRRLFVKEL